MGIGDLTEIVEGAQVVTGNAIACRIHAADLPLRGQVSLIGRVLECGKGLRFVAAVLRDGRAAQAVALAQNYKLEPITTAAPDVPAAIAGVMQTQGYRVVGPKGPWCEIWFRKSITLGPKPSDDAIALAIPQGTLLGVIRWPAQGADRRDQVIKPGVYTLRYSDYPVDGAHQGVAHGEGFHAHGAGRRRYRSECRAGLQNPGAVESESVGYDASRGSLRGTPRAPHSRR